MLIPRILKKTNQNMMALEDDSLLRTRTRNYQVLIVECEAVFYKQFQNPKYFQMSEEKVN